MIGFKMIASGSNGFKKTSSAWTEGSMTSLKFAMSLPKVNVPGQGGRNRNVIDKIEAQFGQIRAAKLADACSPDMDFTMLLTGDIFLKYYFDDSKSSAQIQSELLNGLAGAAGKIGDQVMIHLCNMIQQFKMQNIGNNNRKWLSIEVDL